MANLIRKLKNRRAVPTPSRAVFHLKAKWEYVVIAFLLGLLLAGRSQTHIIRLQQPVGTAFALDSIKPLPQIKLASYKPLEALQPVWVDKRRPYGTYQNGYAPGNCTYYVASRIQIPDNWGNANNWAYAASIAGYVVSSVPKAGDIAQTSGDSYLGHVAIVESVNPDGSFVISEMNAQGLGVIDTRTTTTAEFPNFIEL